MEDDDDEGEEDDLDETLDMETEEDGIEVGPIEEGDQLPVDAKQPSKVSHLQIFIG